MERQNEVAVFAIKIRQIQRGNKSKFSSQNKLIDLSQI